MLKKLSLWTNRRVRKEINRRTRRIL